MTKSIVFKWFVLTALLFSIIFLGIGVAQSYFFEKFYIERKSDSLKASIDGYSSSAAEKGTENASEKLYKNNQIWITELDEYGRISNVEKYYIEVALEDDKLLYIPMYPFKGNFPDVISLLKVGDEVVLDTVNISNEIIPYQVQTASQGMINFSIANRLNGPNSDEAFSHLPTGLYKGIITKTMLPGYGEDIPFPYGENFFLEQVKEFQAGLLAKDAKPLLYEAEYTAHENLVEYKIIAKPNMINGASGYTFAMTSLQPVDEAISTMWQFYPYFLGFTFLCVVGLAFFISSQLAKPLITINRIAGKIAKMDFTEKIPMRSSDEIGQLSQSINHLSEQMESHIGRLEQDLEMERRLETTRKEFIAGVSHELKTPLAVMKSCLSILEDGIAIEKTEHYFQAMENEVQRMDLLIVNMLDLAKFESGTYKPEFAPFAIDEVVEEVCRSLSGQIQERNINLVTTPCYLTVIGHKTLIIRVMFNFLSNAIQHTDNGKSVFIRTIHNGGTVEISVENQGLSISDDDEKKLWQQFYRAETRSTKTGTGLGLSISKSILELHNSTFGVENTEGGVRFFFSLPFQE